MKTSEDPVSGVAQFVSPVSPESLVAGRRESVGWRLWSAGTDTAAGPTSTDSCSVTLSSLPLGMPPDLRGNNRALL